MTANYSLLRRAVFGSTLAGAILSLSFASSARAEVSDAEFQAKMTSYLTKDENVEAVGAALEKFFMKKRDEAQKKASESEAKTLEDQLKNPVKVEIGKAPVRGPAAAPYTIIAFSDFQCPFCKRGADTLTELMKAHPNDVKIAFKNLPLPFHPEARGAAKAALAAGNQGKFWEMHDKLFGGQEGLSQQTYLKLAGELGLNVDKFKTDMESPEIAASLDEDIKLAEKLGVQGTPGFFVNGVQVRGARPAAYFEQIIAKLKESGK